MATGTRVDPYLSFNFLVEIDGITQAGFTDFTGGDTTHEVVEYREGNRPTHPLKLVGQTKVTNVTLKWGLTDSRELYDWFRDVTKGIIQRRNLSVVQLDSTGKEVVRWNLYEAWPAKYDIPDYTGKSNEVSIESVELAFESLEKA
jgi:phage tail-like protein